MSLGPYLYMLFLIGVNLVLYSIQYFQTGSAVIVDNPSWLVFPLVLFLATFTNQHLRDRYAKTLNAIRINQRTHRDCQAFQRLTPPSIKRLLFVLFLFTYYSYIVGFGRIETVVAYEGIPGLIVWFIIAPLGYAPILIEAISIYLSIHFVLPQRIKSHGIKVDFLDPNNFGGLRPLGELLKHSHYLFSVSLTLFTLFIYLPFIFPDYLVMPYRPPEGFITGFILSLWGAGILSLSWSILQLHLYMKQEREDSLTTVREYLNEQLAFRYEIDTLFASADTNQDVLQQLRLLDQIQRTQDLPVTISMWTQIAASTVLPILVELLLRNVTGTI